MKRIIIISTILRCVVFPSLPRTTLGKDDAPSVISTVADCCETRLSARVSDGGKQIKMILSVRNPSKHKIRLALFESWKPMMVSYSGEPVEVIFGQDTSRRPTNVDFPVIPPNKQIKIEILGTIERTAEGAIVKIGDLFGGVWSFTGLKPGKYQFSVVGTNGFEDKVARQFAADAGVPEGEMFSVITGSNWAVCEVK